MSLCEELESIQGFEIFASKAHFFNKTDKRNDISFYEKRFILLLLQLNLLLLALASNFIFLIF